MILDFFIYDDCDRNRFVKLATNKFGIKYL